MGEEQEYFNPFISSFLRHVSQKSLTVKSHKKSIFSACGLRWQNFNEMPELQNNYVHVGVLDFKFAARHSHCIDEMRFFGGRNLLKIGN